MSLHCMVHENLHFWLKPDSKELAGEEIAQTVKGLVIAPAIAERHM